MQGALVIFAAMIVIGLILFLTDKKYYRHHHSGNEGNPSSSDTSTSTSGDSEPEVCCGMHLICEKNGLSPVDSEIIYYDDEELDRFVGKNPEEYTVEESEEFRDILLTLLPEDISGWARSLTLRNIQLPLDVREELLMIVADQRKRENENPVNLD